MYRRRKADFKTLRASSDSIMHPKRKTDFKKQAADQAEKKIGRNPEISDAQVR
jgi:hypothetical protein